MGIYCKIPLQETSWNNILSYLGILNKYLNGSYIFQTFSETISKHCILIHDSVYFNTFQYKFGIVIYCMEQKRIWKESVWKGEKIKRGKSKKRRSVLNIKTALLTFFLRWMVRMYEKERRQNGKRVKNDEVFLI